MNILPETAGLFEPGGVGLTDTRWRRSINNNQLNIFRFFFLDIPLLAFSGVDTDGRTSVVTVSPYFSKRLFATAYVSFFLTSSI
jgi:hypothetical protein